MKTLFALLLLITITASGVMSWLSGNFKLKDGSRFSIMHLELPASDTTINKLINDFAPGTKEALLNQLNADYIFMAGCYPAIMVLCLMAIRQITSINLLQKDLNKKQTGQGWKRILMALTLLQVLAWGLDVWENAQLENWLHTAVANGNAEQLRTRTFVKFGIGIAGFLTAVLVLLLTKDLPKKLTKLKLTSALPKPRKIQGASAGN